MHAYGNAIQSNWYGIIQYWNYIIFYLELLFDKYTLIIIYKLSMYNDYKYYNKYTFIIIA